MGRPTNKEIRYRNVWRKPTITEEVVKKLEYAFAMDCTVWEACLYAWCSRETYYNYLKANPKMVDRFEQLREQPVLTARTTVVKAIGNDPDMAMKYLERKRKKEFSPRIENTWADGEALQAPVVVLPPLNENRLKQ